MEPLASLDDARRKVLRDTQVLLANVLSLASPPIKSAAQGVRLLKRIRQEAYEDINQIQHEHLIVAAAEWLITIGHASRDTEWFWNPRQTGSVSEPDLEGRHGTAIAVSAEITTSANPAGTIATRMQWTLTKLSRMPGLKFYFVSTEAMRMRAKSKVVKIGAEIEVVLLDA